MTLQKAKSIARDLGLTLRLLRAGNYRVNFRDGNETTAYYTDKLEDAVNAAAVVMAHKRAFSSDYRADRTGGGCARRVMAAAHSSGSDEQMLGAKQQVPGMGPSDKEAEPPMERVSTGLRPGKPCPMTG